MPAMLANAKNFLLSSDYSMDKIIFMASGSVTVSAGGADDNYTNHNLPVLPLMKGVWSYTSNFSNSYDMGQPLYSDNDVSVLVQSNSTQYRVYAFNNGGSSKTIYWRVFGVMDTTDTSTLDFTASTADSFVLNTDYNYTKLYLSGDANISSSSVNIDHDLGYKPQVDVWFEAALIPGQYQTQYLGISNDGGVYNSIRITNSQLQFVKGSLAGQSTKYKYRIYLDE